MHATKNLLFSPSFSKDTQTPCAADLEKDARPVDYYNLVFDLDSASMHSDEADDQIGGGQDGGGERKSSSKGGRSRQTSTVDGAAAEKKDATATTTDKQQQQPAPPPPKPIELTEDEKRNIEASEEYLQFIGRSVRVIERALAEEVDIFTDYVGEKDEEALDASEKLKMRRYLGLLGIGLHLVDVELPSTGVHWDTRGESG